MKLKHIFSVLVIILVSGCIHGGQTSSTSPVVQGDAGIDFAIQNVPDYIQSGSTFSFLLEIINYGGYSVPAKSIEVNLAKCGAGRGVQHLHGDLGLPTCYLYQRSR